MPNKTIYRKDYKPYPFQLKQVSLNFDLYDNHALVTNQMVFERLEAGDLHLYGDALELVSVSLDNQPLSKEALEIKEGDLFIRSCPEGVFTVEVVTRIFPQDNTELSGLYRTYQMFCTQCEAEGFRRITFFPDRPDVLSVYQTRITADKAKYPVLLSNGNRIEAGDLEQGRHFAIWHDPFKKPSYLFALVAGDLACVKDVFVTQSGRKVDLDLYVEHGNENKCQHALLSLKKAMKWDEVSYGREYDLDVFMIVAVSDFNMGAMENKGLNIFNSKYILARPDTATDSDYLAIEGVVGHEYFHNWTGNRVTCRDWFQLSLKEGLTVFREQEFASDMNSRAVNRIQDVKILRNSQFPEDAGAMAHPVRPESYQEINNFYTATIYDKGAEVIRMQEMLLGKGGFRRGMDLYFERHDGQAVTIDDFVAAMEDANDVDLSQFKRWYSQAGTPEVEAKVEYNQGTLTLTLSQSCRPTPECQDKKPFHIPIAVALYDQAGNLMPRQKEVLQLKETTQSFYFEGLKEKPVVSLLRGFSAPVAMKQEQSDSEWSQLMRFETDGYAKWNAAQTLTTNHIVDAYRNQREYEALPSQMRSAYLHLLEDETIDLSLRGEVLTPPGFEDIAAHIACVDVGLLESFRDQYRKQLGLELYEHLAAQYQALWAQEDHQMSGESFGRRKLRNVCLWLMMKADEQRALEVCQNQFNTAQTMTDQIAALNLLANTSVSSLRAQVLESFYKQWHQDGLVLDKWFTAQALSELPGTLERVQKLMQHEAFNFKNPNKVRALIGAFCMSNHRHFHAIDGSGYAFLSDVLLKLDQYNPQVAARIATPFTRWRKLDNARQNQMKIQLEKLSEKTLSRDLRELVGKSLENE